MIEPVKVKRKRNGTVYPIHRPFVLSCLVLSVFVTVSWVVISLLLMERERSEKQDGMSLVYRVRRRTSSGKLMASIGTWKTQDHL